MVFALDKLNVRHISTSDVITYANFGDDRLRGLGVAGVQSLPFSIDFDRRLYNTLARVRDNKSSAAAEMGDRGHNRHGPKRGGGLLCPFRGSWDPV